MRIQIMNNKNDNDNNNSNMFEDGVILMPSNVEGMESKRKEVLKGCLLLLLGGLFILGFGIFMLIEGVFPIIPFVGFFEAALFFFGVINIRTYKRAVYESIPFKSILKASLPEVEIDKKRSITKEIIKESGITSEFNSFVCDLYLKGQYKNIKYYCANPLLSNSIEGVTPVKSFNGLFLVFEYGNDDIDETYIYEKNKAKNIHNLKEIKTESIEFNKTYKVFTKNGESAFYILSPIVIESMLKIENQFKGDVSYSYKDSKLYVAINSVQASLDVKLYKNLINELNKMTSRFSTIHELIESLEITRDKYHI